MFELALIAVTLAQHCATDVQCEIAARWKEAVGWPDAGGYYGDAREPHAPAARFAVYDGGQE